MGFCYDELRKKHPSFVYDSFSIAREGRSFYIEYRFVMGETVFSPSWVIPAGENPPEAADSVFRDMVFCLGMVELISYWKAACPPSVEIRAGGLDQKQAEWWKKLYYNGLSEFFYKNGINATAEDFMKLSVSGKRHAARAQKKLSGCLIPVGGGKDSAVTLELLKDYEGDNLAFIINPRGASLECAKTAGYAEKTLCLRRTLDGRLLKLNAAGYLNGHTPFSALAAFAALLCAYIFGKKYIPLSNESSANESTVEGSSVNHQYSKSFEFERDFREYASAYLGAGIEYFSLLRPYSEFQIARYFARLEKYHGIFKSCNVGSKSDVWCGKCPKCLFVCIILSPFLSERQLAKIFERDLLDDAAMIPIMDELIGITPIKPFECVGSRAEARAALCLAIDKNKKARRPALLESFKSRGLYDKYSAEKHEFKNYFDSRHAIPEEFLYTVDLMR